MCFSACKVITYSGFGYHIGLCLPETLVRSLGNPNSIFLKFHRYSKRGLWHALGLWGCHIFSRVGVVVAFLQTGVESWGRQERSVTTKTEELQAYLFFVWPLKATQKAELTYICCIILLSESNSFCLWQRWDCLSHGRCNTLETRFSTPDWVFHWACGIHRWSSEFVPQSFLTLLNTQPDIYILFTVGRQSYLKGYSWAIKNIAHREFRPCWFDGSS